MARLETMSRLTAQGVPAAEAARVALLQHGRASKPLAGSAWWR
jgi:hypothetical protein